MNPIQKMPLSTLAKWGQHSLALAALFSLILHLLLFWLLTHSHSRLAPDGPRLFVFFNQQSEIAKTSKQANNANQFPEESQADNADKKAQPPINAPNKTSFTETLNSSEASKPLDNSESTLALTESQSASTVEPSRFQLAPINDLPFSGGGSGWGFSRPTVQNPTQALTNQRQFEIRQAAEQKQYQERLQILLTQVVQQAQHSNIGFNCKLYIFAAAKSAEIWCEQTTQSQWVISQLSPLNLSWISHSLKALPLGLSTPSQAQCAIIQTDNQHPLRCE